MDGLFDWWCVTDSFDYPGEMEEMIDRDQTIDYNTRSLDTQVDHKNAASFTQMWSFRCSINGSTYLAFA